MLKTDMQEALCQAWKRTAPGLFLQ